MNILKFLVIHPTIITSISRNSLIFLVVCSGDSTVPVYSSTYPIKYWDKVKATEVPNADHNVLLRDDEVINQILSYAIDNYDPNMSLESKKLRFKPDLSNGKALFKEIRRVLPID